MSLTDEQKAMRQTGVGGSEAPTILGQNPYATPLDVWLRKVEGYEQPENANMERGTFLEDGVARWYAHRTGATLTEPGTVRHPSRPLALCTPDRIARLPDQKPRLLSIKVPGPFARESWGEQWSEDVPIGYLMQLQWEDLVLSGLGHDLSDEMHLAAPIDGDLRIYTLRRDRELQAEMLAEVEAWWARYVVTQQAPPIDGSVSCSGWLKRRFPRDIAPLIEAEAADEVMAAALREAEQAEETAKQEAEKARNALKDRIGTAAGIRSALGTVTWKANKNGVRSFRAKWRHQ